MTSTIMGSSAVDSSAVERTINSVRTMWPREDVAAIVNTVNAFAAWLDTQHNTDIWSASAAHVEDYLATLPHQERGRTVTVLKRFFWRAARIGLISKSPLPAPAVPPTYIPWPALAATYNLAVAEVERLKARYKPATACQIDRALGLYLMWCQREHLDPITVPAHRVQRYIEERLPAGRTVATWTNAFWVRRWYDLIVEDGLRSANPLPRVGVIGLERVSPQDPLIAPMRRMLKRYKPSARLWVSSAVSRYAHRAREQGLDPLDVSPAQFDALFDERERERFWRVIATLLEEAKSGGRKNLLGPSGEDLLLTLDRRTGGARRRLLPRWLAYAASAGYPNAVLAPNAVRDRFLSQIAAEGRQEALRTQEVLTAAGQPLSAIEFKRLANAGVTAMRNAMRVYDRAHRGDLDIRPLTRVEKFRELLITYGLDGQTADLAIEALHAGYAEAVKRAVEAVVARYLKWTLANGVSTWNPSDAEVLAFYVSPEKYRYLGIEPVRRVARVVAQRRDERLRSSILQGARPRDVERALRAVEQARQIDVTARGAVA